MPVCTSGLQSSGQAETQWWTNPGQQNPKLVAAGTTSGELKTWSQQTEEWHWGSFHKNPIWPSQPCKELWKKTWNLSKNVRNSCLMISQTGTRKGDKPFTTSGQGWHCTHPGFWGGLWHVMNPGFTFMTLKCDSNPRNGCAMVRPDPRNPGVKLPQQKWWLSHFLTQKDSYILSMFKGHSQSTRGYFVPSSGISMRLTSGAARTRASGGIISSTLTMPLHIPPTWQCNSSINWGGPTSLTQRTVQIWHPAISGCTPGSRRTSEASSMAVWMSSRKLFLTISQPFLLENTRDACCTAGPGAGGVALPLKDSTLKDAHESRTDFTLCLQNQKTVLTVCRFVIVIVWLRQRLPIVLKKCIKGMELTATTVHVTACQIPKTFRLRKESVFVKTTEFGIRLQRDKSVRVPHLFLFTTCRITKYANLRNICDQSHRLQVKMRNIRFSHSCFVHDSVTWPDEKSRDWYLSLSHHSDMSEGTNSFSRVFIVCLVLLL